MTAVDTNVLVRYLVNDLPEQAQAARELLNGLSPEEPGFVCREVLLEVVFVLERGLSVPTRPNCERHRGTGLHRGNHS